jgi:hypothetical protein
MGKGETIPWHKDPRWQIQHLNKKGEKKGGFGVEYISHYYQPLLCQ